ncbi:MAG: damage-inducible protein DinB [Gemmatimonas sp.]|nr:damage-inducible protein DinB [Gemmatimonas sp.]
MDIAIPLDEFDREMATTRRLLERVPSERGTWKPHEKSFPLAHLAQLVAWMPGWIAQTLNDPFIDLASGSGYSTETTDVLLATFDRSVEDARAALQSVTGAGLQDPWSLKMGGQILFTQPKGAAVRDHLNHFIHHRGQLTVYLRLLDVPLPSIYGPTADEGWEAAPQDNPFLSAPDAE